MGTMTLAKPKTVWTSKDRWRAFLITVFCIVAVVLSGTRDLDHLPNGNDTPNYYIIYQNVEWSTWGGLLRNLSLFSDEYSGRDTGYSVFVKATQLISTDFMFFMFFTAMFFMIPFGMLIFKYVKSYGGIILVFLLFFALFSNIINSFMRQAISLGIVLFAFRYIESRDWKRYFGILLVAFLIHGSSLIVAPLFFLPLLTRNKKWLVMALMASPVLIVFSRRIFSFVLVGSIYEVYGESEVSSPITYTLFVFLISLFAVLYYKGITESGQYGILLGAVIGSLLMLPIVFMGNTMLRISYYYVLPTMLLFPVAIDQLNTTSSTRKIIYFILIAIFTLYIFR